MRRIPKVICLLLTTVMLTGCWDKVEIDQKTFVSIMGVDAGDDIGKEKELKKLKPDEPLTSMDLKKIHVTFGSPDVSKLGPEKGGTAKDLYIDSDAYSMQDAIAKASLKSSREIAFSHIKLLVFGSNLLTYPETFKEVVDYLQRQPSLDRMMLLVLAQGRAEEYIKYKPTMEKNIENYMTGLMENTQRNSTIVAITLNDFLKLLDQNGNGILPYISMNKDKNELKVSGSGIIKDYKIKGYLTDSETSNLKILRGNFKGGTKVVYREGHPIDITIDGSERKIKVKNTEKGLVFTIDVNLEGQLKGYSVGKEALSSSFLNSIQQDFNKSIQEECYQVIKITQQQFQVDPIGLREYVEKYHPMIWNQIKNNWGDAYKNAKINVNVDTKVRRIGVIR